MIVWFDGVLQLYFIPVFIYTFIKVKSKLGKKRDGCAMKMAPAIFSFVCKTFKGPGAKVKQNTPSAHPR